MFPNQGLHPYPFSLKATSSSKLSIKTQRRGPFHYGAFRCRVREALKHPVEACALETWRTPGVQDSVIAIIAVVVLVPTSWDPHRRPSHPLGTASIRNSGDSPTSPNISKTRPGFQTQSPIGRTKVVCRTSRLPALRRRPTRSPSTPDYTPIATRPAIVTSICQHRAAYPETCPTLA